MDEDRSTAFSIAAVSPEDFEDWFDLALALWPEEEETDRQDLRHTLTEILNADHQTGWIVRDASGAAIAFMNLSLRQDYVPGATQSPVAYSDATQARG